ncbi:MAG: putative ABC transporter permease [Oscillospiraceae bacterium]|nr:putative ABC transporter permease [Candidatus Limimonas coprohippi]
MTEKRIRFIDIVWMFFFCSLIGLLSEGFYTLYLTGHWESHVITMLIPICPIYGLGSVLFYYIDHSLPHVNIIFKSIIIGTAATLMEFLCGLLLYYGYGMRAWDYTGARFNILGIICLEFLFCWMLFAFGYLVVVRGFRKIAENKKLERPAWFTSDAFRIITIIFAVIMVVDIISAFVNIKFWSARHYGNPVDKKVEQLVENKFDDEYMRDRFVEWRFLK